MTASLRNIPLTASQRAALCATYAYIEAFIERCDLPPSIFQVARGMRIKYRVAQFRVELMEFLGWLVRDVDRGVIELRGVT